MNFNFPIFSLQSLTISLGLSLLFFQQTFAYVPLDRIVAVVNEDVIMLSEFEARVRRVRGQLVQQKAELPPSAVLERRVLENLIQSHIQLQLAERIGIQIDDVTLNKAVSDIAAENQVTLVQFKDILKQDNFNYEQFRKDIRKEMTLAQLRKKQVESRIIVTDREIDDFLANQQLQENLQTEVQLSHILFSISVGATQEEIEQIKERANRIRTDLLAGADFAELAKAVSDGQNAENGGDLGWRRIEQMPTVFVDYVSEMGKGDISELIQSASGFHIIKITDIKSDEKNIVAQTHARHILIKTDASISDEQAREKLEHLLLRIKKGDDFALLAKGNSDDSVSALNGGDLGWRVSGEFVPKFQNVIDSLPIGEISRPFKTVHGWHIVQVLERRNYDNTESVERNKARSILYNRKLNEAVQNWARELRDEAYVEYRLDDDY